MKAALLAILLALFLPLVSAYQLGVSVSVSEGTAGVGTNVSLVTGGVVLSEKKAGLDGKAKFDVNSGSYFVLLRRYSYPLHVSLVEVGGDLNISLSMRQLISYASAYGQISGPSDFSNASVVAYSGGEVAKRVAVDRHGSYMLSYLPEGNYDLAFESPGFEAKRLQVFLPLSDFVEVNAELTKPLPAQEPATVLAAPGQAQQFSAIEAALTKGGLPLAGVLVAASTPSGSVSLTTDASGKVRINAALPGSYTFTYGNLSATSIVAAKEAAKPKEEPKNATPAAPQGNQSQQPSPEAQTGGMVLPALALLGGFVLVVLVILLAFGAKIFLGTKKGQEKEKPGQGSERHAGHRKK